MIIINHETLGGEDYTLIFEVIFVRLFLFSVLCFLFRYLKADQLSL